MAKKENKANKSVFFRIESGENFNMLYKTVVTQDTFDELMYDTDVRTGERLPYEAFEKCMFLGCDMSQMESLKGAFFSNCVFMDCDFGYSNPYKTAFENCYFENNDWHKAKMSMTQFTNSKFYGDDFSATEWRSRYWDKPEDPRSDLEDCTFYECDVRGADIGTCINDVRFINCNGPVKTIQNLDQRFRDVCYGPYWKKERDGNVYDLTTKAVYRGGEGAYWPADLKKQIDDWQRLGAVPDPLLIDTHIAKMESILNRMDWDEDFRTRRTKSDWKNLDGLKEWVSHTDTRFPKTVSEYRSNKNYLYQYASRPDNRDKYEISRDNLGNLKSIKRRNDVELVLENGLSGGRSRGSRSIGD